MNSATIVQKLWNYCNVLRDDGMSYGDYVGVKADAGIKLQSLRHRIEFIYIVSCQFKIKNAQVILHVLRRLGAGQGHDSQLM